SGAVVTELVEQRPGQAIDRAQMAPAATELVYLTSVRGGDRERGRVEAGEHVCDPADLVAAVALENRPVGLDLEPGARVLDAGLESLLAVRGEGEAARAWVACPREAGDDAVVRHAQDARLAVEVTAADVDDSVAADSDVDGTVDRRLHGLPAELVEA